VAQTMTVTRRDLQSCMRRPPDELWSQTKN